MAFLPTGLKHQAREIAKALGDTLPGRRTATAYEFDGALYVVAQGASDCDVAYVPEDALRVAKGDASVLPVTDNLALTVACFMSSGRSLADATGNAVLSNPQIEALSHARAKTLTPI
jgi:hypothetical protein